MLSLRAARSLLVLVPLTAGWGTAPNASQSGDVPAQGTVPAQDPPTEVPASTEAPAEAVNQAPPSAASDEAGAEPTPAAPRPRWTPAYRDLAATRALLEVWASEFSELCRVGVLGTSYGGHEVPYLEFGAPSDIELGERVTLFLVGGLDGVSLTGSEAVLAIVAELLADPSALPRDVAFVAVPWAAPDGLATWVTGRGNDGRNTRPVDDDGDGVRDEDGPDDLDADGNALDLLIEDPAGEWTHCRDARFLRRASAGDAPRLSVLREGGDDDGDGQRNEDPLGGVVLDRQFPVGWMGPWEGYPAGDWPLSEPLARALADRILARRTLGVLVFQGHHGRLAAPGGVDDLLDPSALDLYAAWTRRFGEVTGRAPEPLASLAQIHATPQPGTLVDWSYTIASAFAAEIAAWGPGVGRGALAEQAPSDDRQPEDARWAQWLDDAHGGIGFAEWTPVTLHGERANGSERAWVGGWEPRTRVNAPVAALETAVQGLAEFVRQLALARPVLSIEVVRSVATDGVRRLSARVRNTGALPSGLGSGLGNGLVSSRRGGTLKLLLPPGGRMLAGVPERRLRHLPAGGVSEIYDWLLIVPDGGQVVLVADDDWADAVEYREGL